MPTHSRVITDGPSRDAVFDSARLPRHGLEVRFTLQPPRGKAAAKEFTPTPRSEDPPAVWDAYARHNGTIAATYYPSVLVAVTGIELEGGGRVGLEPTWYLLKGRVAEGPSSYWYSQTTFTARYCPQTRQGDLSFNWETRS